MGKKIARPVAAADVEGFVEFWAAYPIRVGRLSAIKAYATAIKLATPAEILAGVEHYKAVKPAWQAWAHPASWLRAGRWMDEAPPAEPVRERPFTPEETRDAQHMRRAIGRCPHDPPCASFHACVGVIVRQWRAEQAGE
jgi:hypothetical protein